LPVEILRSAQDDSKTNLELLNELCAVSPEDVPGMRRESNDGIGCSAVDSGGVRHVVATAVPRAGSTLQEQAADALDAIRTVADREGSGGSIVSQTVFLRDPRDVDACRRIMRDFYGADLPATTYVSQPPCGGERLAIEAWGVGRGSGEVEIHRLSGQLVGVAHHGMAGIHCGHVGPGTTATTAYEQSLDVFARMKDLLVEAGARFDQVVRTWLYLGRIVGREGSTVRYQELNRARTDFYRGVAFGNHRAAVLGRCGAVYPASTGIGAAGDSVLMGAIALATARNDVRLVPLENPRQTPAFDYAARYGPASPKFSRAMVVAAGTGATIFISGTASIADSQSRHPGDVRRQTEETLENIAALVSGENLARHGLAGFGAAIEDLTHVRVYLKRREDFEAVRAVCRARLGPVPAVYAVADVCREELLVEIEGLAFAARSGAAP